VQRAVGRAANQALITDNTAGLHIDHRLEQRIQLPLFDNFLQTQQQHGISAFWRFYLFIVSAIGSMNMDAHHAASIVATTGNQFGGG